MYGIRKKPYDKDAENWLFVSRLKRSGEIADNNRVFKGLGVGWVKEYKTQSAAEADLKKMEAYGYDDYEVVDLEPLRKVDQGLRRGVRFI